MGPAERFPSPPDHVRQLSPYVPGKPIEETKREFGLTRVIKLASNENPLGPSPKALAAIAQTAPEIHLYPDSSGFKLRQVLATKYAVSPAEVAISNGSDDMIDLLIRAYTVPGDSIVMSDTGFVAYAVRAGVQNLKIHRAPVDPETLRTTLDRLASLAIQDPRARFIFLANPNNPTGTFYGASEVRGMLERIDREAGGRVCVVLDQAYWEFIEDPDAPDVLALRKEFPFVVVIHTFSKLYSLGGLRLGFALAPVSVVQDIDRIRQPFNVNALAMEAGIAALGDEEHRKRSLESNRRGMKQLKLALDEMGVPHWPSQGNFLLVNAKVGFGLSGREVFQAALKRGVIFRPVDNYGLPQALRISIGTEEENAWAIQVLREIQTKRS